MRILLLGATGQVGWELRGPLAALGTLTTTARDGVGDHRVDATDLAALRRTLEIAAPDVVVNAVAYTAVDRAEQEPELARRLNAEVPAVIGEWAAANAALVVHYSTDYVFDGRGDRPYRESDRPGPLSVYGRTKLAGDEAVLASGCDALILRVGWVYGLRGSNFLLTMRRLMGERRELAVVDDQLGTPTWCRSIARHTATVVAQAMSRDRRELTGVYHLAPHGHTSWFGFASAIREALDLDCALKPIPTSQYPTAAQRPGNSRLDSAKIRATFGLQLADWRQDLHDCLADLHGA